MGGGDCGVSDPTLKLQVPRCWLPGGLSDSVSLCTFAFFSPHCFTVSAPLVPCLSLCTCLPISLCTHFPVSLHLSPSPLVSLSTSLPLLSICLITFCLSLPILLSVSPPSLPHPILSGPWAGPSAGQGSGDDWVLPLAAACWGLCVAAVCGHRGCEWEEPWGAPRALGQLRAQVRVSPTHPRGVWNLLQKPLLSVPISRWELFSGLLEGDKSGGD